MLCSACSSLFNTLYLALSCTAYFDVKWWLHVNVFLPAESTHLHIKEISGGFFMESRNSLCILRICGVSFFFLMLSSATCSSQRLTLLFFNVNRTVSCPDPPSVVSCSSERDIRGLSELSGVFPRQRLRALSRATLPVPAEGGDVSPWNLSPRLPCRTLRTEREGHQPLHEYVSNQSPEKNVGNIRLHKIQIR